MLRARIGNTLVFGLEPANIKALQEGKPMFLDLEHLGFEAKIVIFAGESKEQMIEYLLEKIGLRMPDVPS